MASTDTQLLLRLSADVSRFQKQMARIMDAGEATAVGVENRFRSANKRMAQSAEQSGNAIAKEMDRLRSKYDPVYAASKRYSEQLDELNRAQKVGAISAQQHAAALERLNADYTRASVGQTKLAASGGRVGTSLAGMGSGLQNVSYQVADFATQVGAGTSAAVAAGQQLPQLLAGFGALGAVLGAVAAIALPVGAALLFTGESSETLQEQMDGLKGAIDDYVSAAKDASMPTEELAEKYGTATEAARTFVASLRAITEVTAREKLDQTFDRIAESLGRLQEMRNVRGDVMLGAGVQKLIDDFGLAYEEAKRVAGALEDMGRAEGAKAQAEAAETLLAALEQALGPYEDMNAEARSLYESTRDAGEQAAQLAGKADSASAGISSAASEAAKLADELKRAVENAIELAAQGLDDVTRARIEYDFRDDPRGRAAALAAEDFDARTEVPEGADDTIKNVIAQQREEFIAAAVSAEDYRQKLIAWRKEQSAAGKSSSGRKGKKETPLFEQSDKELQSIERQIEMIGKTSEQMAELQARYALLDEAKKRGLDLDAAQIGTGETLREQIERQAEAVGALTGKYEQAAAQAEFYEGLQGQVKDGMIDAIVEGDNLAGTLEDVAKALAKAALQAALFGEGPLASLFGSEGGGLLSSIGSMLGGGGAAPVPGRAAGGTVLAGRGYRTSEHGPELFFPAVNGRILSAAQTQKAMAGGGEGGMQTVRVEVVPSSLTLSDEGAVSARIDLRAAQAGQAAVSEVRSQIRDGRGIGKDIRQTTTANARLSPR